jgi:hypothetical protein
MASTDAPDRQLMLLWSMLVVVGAVLCVVGWQRFFFFSILPR